MAKLFTCSLALAFSLITLGAASAGDAVPQPAPASAPAATPAQADDNWPCVQRLQPELSIGSMWTGPDPSGELDHWQADGAVSALVKRIAPRHTPEEEAEADIHRFASGYDKDRPVMLTRAFAGLFETLNEERGSIIRGIGHYHARQAQLAARIKDTLKAMDALDDKTTDPAVIAKRDALQEQLNWDSRVFDERERLLPQVCEQPLVLERRLFALSRILGDELDAAH
jgi:hypothetical protein